MIAKVDPESTSINSPLSQIRVAWLLQDAGAYWQPILSEFTRLCSSTKVFTAAWIGFLPGFENSFSVKQVGTLKVFSAAKQVKGYAPSITYLSPQVIIPLLEYKPEVVFTTGFSIWTILALLFKRLGKWRVVVVYDGSTSGVEYSGNGFRLFLRKQLIKLTDKIITNSQAGYRYLVDVLGVRSNCVIVRPYLVPHPKTYLCGSNELAVTSLTLGSPTFIFSGHHISRKGLLELLKACTHLKHQGYHNYSLLILGEGPQTAELKAYANEQGLEAQIQWIGWVAYEQVRTYFDKADVFIFPTLEDVWGMVAVEAMLFGKPILCSKWAGTAELVVDGQNGFIFDPYDSEQLANQMIRFIESPELIAEMGEQSRLVMAKHTPEQVAQSLAQVVEMALAE